MNQNLDKEKVLNVCLRAGIGDIIASKSVLLDRAPLINVKINEGCLGLRGGADYRVFLQNFAKLLFCEPEFCFQGFGPEPPTGWSDFGLDPKRLPFQTKLHENIQSPVSGKYICITTKSRGPNGSTFFKEHEILVDGLKKISNNIKIVLLGEKEIEVNSEVAYLKNFNMISNIYDMAITIPGIIDMTIPKLGLTSPTFDVFQRDCACMANSIAVINSGQGGNTVFSSAVARTVNLVENTTDPKNVYYLKPLTQMFPAFSYHTCSLSLLEEINKLVDEKTNIIGE